MCNLKQYAPTFKAEGINGLVLLDLNDEDLEELGVASKFHRRKIVKMIDAARQAAE